VVSDVNAVANNGNVDAYESAAANGGGTSTVVTSAGSASYEYHHLNQSKAIDLIGEALENTSLLLSAKEFYT